ncbi:MAG: hypothetical protein IMF26_02840 [Candidatus Fermentithermobacillus carboniphilus]|uniref:Uncharacterized protein n=1 Tax=Candidatus Fermentithermobacillus carboniphilus TaxID=3085328 RepID=A0AAT9LD62_9FIRM|nr:MAG: hypothetical protein IMF26_02840 [Candidatus Fermentithermobacillus carboniphilus]
MKKQLPFLLTLAVALFIMFGNYTFIGQKLQITGSIDRYFQVSQAAAFMVGAINLTRIHSTNILRRRSGYYNSVVLLLCLWAFFLLGLIKGNADKTYRWVYNATVVPMESTMFSLIAFYIASAAYRAFRAKSFEAVVLLLTAFVVMLGNVPLGDVIWRGIPVIKDWIMGVPNSAGMRGIAIGTYIGSFATSLRILLGLERAHLGGGS